MDNDIVKLLDMLRKCAGEEKATLKLNEIACKTLVSYIEQLHTNRDRALDFIYSREFNSLATNKKYRLGKILRGDSE